MIFQNSAVPFYNKFFQKTFIQYVTVWLVVNADMDVMRTKKNIHFMKKNKTKTYRKQTKADKKRILFKSALMCIIFIIQIKLL